MSGVVGLLGGAGTASRRGPDAADRALLADPRLVLEPGFDALVGVTRACLLYRLRQDVFLKSAWAAASALGCCGRGTSEEKPRRCSRK